MKLLARVIAATLAILLLISALAGCARVYEPLFYLKKTLKKTIEESVGGEVAAFLLHTLDGGSIAVDFGGTDLTDSFADSAEIKAFFDAEEHRVALMGEVVVDGKTYDGAAFATDRELVLKSAALFGSTTLGVCFDTLEQDLKNSIFSNKSGTAYAKPEISESTAKSVNDVREGLFSMLADLDDRIELTDEILETFLAQLTEHAANGRYRKGGRSYISLSVNNDTLSRTIRATREALVKDRSFCREMRKIAATRDALASARTGVITREYSTDLEYFLSSSSSIDALCLKIDSADPFLFELEAKIKNAGDRLETARIFYTEDGELRLRAELMLGREGEESELSLLFDGVERRFTYTPVKDTFRALEVAFSYEKCEGERTLLSLDGTLAVNRRAKTYMLGFETDEVALSFAGAYEMSASTFRFSVEGAERDGEERMLSLSVTAKRSDKMPSIPDYTNLVTIDSKRYAPIDERAKETYEALKSAWKSAPTPYNTLEMLFETLGLAEELPPPPNGEEADPWWEELFD